MDLDLLIAAVNDFKRASTPIAADESFQRVARWFAPLIERHVRSQPLLDAEDARQECLLSVWHAVEDFDADAYFPAAIVRLANMKMRSRLMDLVEAHNAKRRNGRPLSLDHRASTNLDPADPYDHLATVDSDDLLDRYRAAFPHILTDRQAATIFALAGGATLTEIAQQQGCRIQRVHDSIAVVRAKMRLATANAPDRFLDAPAAILAMPSDAQSSLITLPMPRRQPPKKLTPIIRDQPKQRNRSSPKGDRARQLILDTLANGETSSSDIVRAAAEFGISGNVVREVARTLPIEAREIGFGRDHRRLWRLVDNGKSTTGETHDQ